MKTVMFIAAVVLTALAGCAAVGGNGSLAFGKNDNGTERTLTVGQTFRLELPSNPTTGYDWHIARLDERYFRVPDTGYTPSKPRLSGSGGVKWWEIKALKPGRSTVSLLYYRVWEGPDQAVEKYEITFIIKIAAP